MARSNPKTRRTVLTARNPQPNPQPTRSTFSNMQATVNQILQNAQQAQDDGDLDNVIPQSIDALTQMTDSELAQVVRDSKNIDMPYHLRDVSNDTQKFVFAIGLNDKPQVLQGQAFDDYLRDNNIPRSHIMSRSVNGGTVNVNGTSFNQTPQQVIQQMLYGKYNYIGGKRGGNAYGNGAYFSMNGGANTGYGNNTINAVLSPSARTISLRNLQSQVPKWQASHPLATRAIGRLTNDNYSIYALCMGYNVITDGDSAYYAHDDYHNVIDRGAIICRG